MRRNAVARELFTLVLLVIIVMVKVGFVRTTVEKGEREEKNVTQSSRRDTAFIHEIIESRVPFPAPLFRFRRFSVLPTAKFQIPFVRTLPPWRRQRL
jgi:hypothetical protein